MRPFFCSMTETKRFLFILENSLTEKIISHYLLPLIQSERMCVAQTPEAVKWESVKEFLHLSTNLFPNNKSSLPVTSLAGVVFAYNMVSLCRAEYVPPCIGVNVSIAGHFIYCDNTSVVEDRTEESDFIYS